MRRLAVLTTALGFLCLVACGWDVTSPTSLPPAAVRPEAVLVGAGDIGRCGAGGTELTAKLIDGIDGTVFTAGDNAYPSGRAADFRDCYDPSWGRHKARTRPSPGNHDYESPNAQPYFDYFGANAGANALGYYSYRLGDWQIYSLNSNIPMDAGSAQNQWLRQELALHPATCALAYWHHPLFSSGRNGDTPATRPLWRTLYDAGVDVIVVGHDHLYERFALQDPDGRPDAARGIRQFIIGTGGAELTEPVRVHANSDVRWSGLHGVLKLTLRDGSYGWMFITATAGVADTGEGLCHDPSHS